jgi:hypothetical protein
MMRRFRHESEPRVSDLSTACREKLRGVQYFFQQATETCGQVAWRLDSRKCKSSHQSG